MASKACEKMLATAGKLPNWALVSDKWSCPCMQRNAPAAVGASLETSVAPRKSPLPQATTVTRFQPRCAHIGIHRYARLSVHVRTHERVNGCAAASLLLQSKYCLCECANNMILHMTPAHPCPFSPPAAHTPEAAHHRSCQALPCGFQFTHLHKGPPGERWGPSIFSMLGTSSCLCVSLKRRMHRADLVSGGKRTSGNKVPSIVAWKMMGEEGN
eukprot:scaffold18888_cov20-Tisochrysis_lutea.AAC.1